MHCIQDVRGLPLGIFPFTFRSRSFCVVVFSPRFIAWPNNLNWSVCMVSMICLIFIDVGTYYSISSSDSLTDLIIYGICMSCGIAIGMFFDISERQNIGERSIHCDKLQYRYTYNLYLNSTLIVFFVFVLKCSYSLYTSHVLMVKVVHK